MKYNSATVKTTSTYLKLCYKLMSEFT